MDDPNQPTIFTIGSTSNTFTIHWDPEITAAKSWSSILLLGSE